MKLLLKSHKFSLVPWFLHKGYKQGDTKADDASTDVIAARDRLFNYFNFLD